MSKVKGKTLNGRVLILPDEVEQETSFGFLLPDQDKIKPVTGTVVIGNELVSEGDRVLFSRFGYDEVKIENVMYYVVSPDCVLFKYE